MAHLKNAPDNMTYFQRHLGAVADAAIAAGEGTWDSAAAGEEKLTDEEKVFFSFSGERLQVAEVAVRELALWIFSDKRTRDVEHDGGYVVFRSVTH